MEGKERDAKRQHDIELRHRQAQNQAEIVGKEIGVFEHAEDGQIDDDGRGDDRLAFGSRESKRGQPVDRDRQRQQQDERRIPVAVEGERQHHQRADPPLRMGIGKAVEQDGGRQKTQQERIVVEQHQSAILGARFGAHDCSKPEQLLPQPALRRSPVLEIESLMCFLTREAKCDLLLARYLHIPRQTQRLEQPDQEKPGIEFEPAQPERR